MIAYLNELSYSTLEDSNEVQRLFTKIANTCGKIRALGVRDVKVQASFLNYNFAYNYSFNSWIQDYKTDSDIRTLLVSIFTTSPFADEIVVEHENLNSYVIEMYCEGSRCVGLGLASSLIFNTVALSISESVWRAPEYNVQAKVLEETDDGSVADATLEGQVRNITIETEAINHSAHLISELGSAISNGKLLWEKRNEYFPNLEFCNSIQGQLQHFTAGHAEFKQILIKLFELQEFVRQWDRKPFNPSEIGIKVTKESETRLRDFKKELTILCLDNQFRLFDLHCRYTPGAGRIHFEPDYERGVFIIGSIANQNKIK